MVQISIDTSRDSVEEIRNTVRYLQSILGDEIHNTPTSSVQSSESVSSTPSSQEEAPASGAFSMFSGMETFESTSFGSDEEAPSDYIPEKKDDEIEADDAVVEIVEF